MNPKDQLDNNELKQNQEPSGEGFPDTKNNEIVGKLGALEKKSHINIIKEDEKTTDTTDTIEQVTDEVNAIKEGVFRSKNKKNGEYVPGNMTDENITLNRANKGREKAATGPKQLVQSAINNIEQTSRGKRISTSRIGEKIKKQLI